MTCPLPEVYFSYELDGFELQATSFSEGIGSLIWTLDGSAFSQDSSFTFSLESGLYELCLLAMNSCGSDSLCVSLVVNPLGSGIDTHQNTLLIYPNPVHDELVIDFGTEGTLPLRIVVSDLSGRQIILAFKMIAHSNQKAVLNTTLMDPGLYLLEVELTSGERIRLPFIKE
jgi:hypothetical protein